MLNSMERMKRDFREGQEQCESGEADEAKRGGGKDLDTG